jgi:hypothetical protein
MKDEGGRLKPSFSSFILHPSSFLSTLSLPGGSIVAPLIAACVLMLCGLLASGPSFGLFIAGLFIVGILTPPMCLAQLNRIDSIVAAAVIADVVGCFWLASVVRGPVSFGQWIQAYILLIAFAAAVWSVSTGLAKLRLDATLASALSVVITLLWLTWPIWLATVLNETLVTWLTPAHPGLALNGLFASVYGPWSHQTIAYRLTNLGQDVPYVLPTNAWMSVALHGGIAMAIGLIMRFTKTRGAAHLR